MTMTTLPRPKNETKTKPNSPKKQKNIKASPKKQPKINQKASHKQNNRKQKARNQTKKRTTLRVLLWTLRRSVHSRAEWKLYQASPPFCWRWTGGVVPKAGRSRRRPLPNRAAQTIAGSKERRPRCRTPEERCSLRSTESRYFTSRRHKKIKPESWS